MRNKELLWAVALFPLSAMAQNESFREVAQRTLLDNPEVQVRYHTWQAAKEERTAAAGGFLPRVDLSAGTGREQRSRTGVGSATYTETQTTVTLTQMLFDGFATRNEVQRLDHAALVRFFELHDASENITLEVVRAYVDVSRFRELVALAEENYVRHRAVYELMENKVGAGVGRRVDLETSAGRLALAESNLLTETANLHDVTARFTRLTGKFPGKDLGPLPSLAAHMPADANAALNAALQRNPALWAALNNIRSAKSAANARTASHLPRLELQARSASGRNNEGVIGEDRTNSIGLVLTWNLFNGGSDSARARQFAQQANAAHDLLDKACRDLRQTLLIAYNDAGKLTAQIRHLEQHQLSTEKARDAYRQQFEIGQRSLLDLLDTENELFQSKRSYANARHDLLIAHARVVAAMGKLVPSLGLTAQGSDTLSELLQSQDMQELAGQCQLQASVSHHINREALEARVREQKRSVLQSATTPAPSTAASGAQQVTPSAASGAQQVTPSAASANSQPANVINTDPAPAVITAPAPVPASIPAPASAPAPAPVPASPPNADPPVPAPSLTQPAPEPIAAAEAGRSEPGPGETEYEAAWAVAMSAPEQSPPAIRDDRAASSATGPVFSDAQDAGARGGPVREVVSPGVETFAISLPPVATLMSSALPEAAQVSTQEAATAPGTPVQRKSRPNLWPIQAGDPTMW